MTRPDNSHILTMKWIDNSKMLTVGLLDVMLLLLHRWTSTLRDRNVWGGWILAENQGNHQNFDPSLIPKTLTNFHGDEAKNSKG